MESHKAYFNRLAPEWNDLMPDDPAFRDLLSDFGIHPGDRILDMGTGTGKMAAHLSALTGPQGLVIAQDIALGMVDRGRKSYSQQNIHWLCENAESLSFPQNIFDKVLCFSAFPHFQNKPAVLGEILRVLKPGGTLLILHISSSKELNAFHANLKGPVSGDILPPAGKLAGLLSRTGFILTTAREEESLYRVSGIKPRGRAAR
jgi:ubiquinone/menaquinone biosynthesis C-methylase UbiE